MTEIEADSDAETGLFDHDAWRALVGAGAGYGVVLAAMFVALFVIPFLVFLVL